MVSLHKFSRQQTIVGIDNVLLRPLRDGVEKRLVERGDLVFFVIEIIRRAEVIAQ
jgi:hypothetical protein